MCGFAGYKAFASMIIDRALLQELCQVLEHRGPDDAGIAMVPEHQLALVARRLSIIDVSPAGAQPMWDESKTVILVFNGEIYNFKKLREQLISLGYSFRSHSDTEVVIAAYKQWGITCLERFDGMFAGALYDTQCGQLFLFRDRMGKKPLYFSTQGNMISFASEIKALWKMPWITRHISVRGLSHYLTYLATPAPMTIFEGIYKLPAGFYATVTDTGQTTFSQWYDPIVAIKEVDPAPFLKKSYNVATIRTLLQQAVSKRLLADVPVGALLSGGLDSSLIVAMMAQEVDVPETFTVSFEDDPHQERSWAKKIAKKFGTNHHELILTEQDAYNFFDKMVYHQDEPLGDSVCVPLYYVSKLARDAGVKVLLSGEGADELFCGYPMYVEYMALARYWKTTQQYLPSFAKKSVYYAARPFYANYPNRQDMLKSWSQDRDLFWGGVRVFSQSWKEEIMRVAKNQPFDPIIEKIYPGMSQGFDSYAIADYHRAQFYKNKPDGDFFASMTYIELKHRLPELLLTRTDKMSMAASIEARVPFMDQKLVEAALCIPMKFKYMHNETKYLLKRVAEGILPREIIYRKKVGFASPVTHWFKEGGYFKESLMAQLDRSSIGSDLVNTKMVKELVMKNSTSSVDYSYQLWALHNVLAFL